MIFRHASAQIASIAKWYPVVAVTGPRQSGKTTLVRMAFPDKPYLSMEDPDLRATAADDARRFLALYPSGAIIDEAQRVPELFSYLQGLVDEDRYRAGESTHTGVAAQNGRWILTGSQQFGLLSNITQSLAGRVGLLQLLPLSVSELLDADSLTKTTTLETLLWRGLYPAPALAQVPPSVWYADYFSTYVERDVRQMLQVKDLQAFRLFVRMCAARASQVLNLSGLAADCGISTNTAKSWLSILEASYICYCLQPHHANFGKQLTKAPKLYFYDTGLVAWLTGLRSASELGISSMRGALFENWAITEAYKHIYNHRLDTHLHYWRNKAGVEIDLLIDDGKDKMHAIEMKSGHTVAGDWFKNLIEYSALNTQAQAHVLYGGSDMHSRHGITVAGWRDWPAFLTQHLPALPPEA
jgi:hypothetical protein